MIKSKSMAAAAAALAMCMAGSAFADDRRSDQEHRHERFEQRSERQQQRQFERHGGGNQFHGWQDEHPGRNFDRGGYPHPRSEWHRGGRVPHEYRGRHHQVDDWRGHRLHAPAQGQQWVSVGGDYVLAAIATGLIAQIIAGQ